MKKILGLVGLLLASPVSAQDTKTMHIPPGPAVAIEYDKTSNFKVTITQTETDYERIREQPRSLEAKSLVPFRPYRVGRILRNNTERIVLDDFPFDYRPPQPPTPISSSTPDLFSVPEFSIPDTIPDFVSNNPEDYLFNNPEDYLFQNPEEGDPVLDLDYSIKEELFFRRHYKKGEALYNYMRELKEAMGRH